MKPSPNDRRAALRLLRPAASHEALDAAPDATIDAMTFESSAALSFLAAIKRIRPVSGSAFATAETDWVDATGDPGTAYLSGPISNPTLDAAPVRVSIDDGYSDSAVHAFTPDGAEARGWELIALAHLARTSPSIAPLAEGGE